MMKDEQGPDMGLIVAWALVLVMTGCGGGDMAGGTSGADSSRTPQEEIARLEASGELPVLEREPTLGGIDTNANGVRDDIERYIEKKYTEPAQRKAAMQTARALQRMLLVDTSNPVAVEAAVDASARAVDCIFDTFAGVEGSQLSQAIESMSTNTKDRLKAYVAFNKAASGSVSGSFKGRGCD